MMVRQCLPSRRNSTTFDFEHISMRFTATVSYFHDGRLLTNHRNGSHADAVAKDSAIVCSIALQYGVPVDVIRKALVRDARGNAGTPLGAVLDLLEKDSNEFRRG
jgi:hypothetical protein